MRANNMSRDSKTVVASAKQINEQHRLAIQCAESAIEHAIMCGQMLVDKKLSLGHGGFQDWIEKNCEFEYSTAARYMKAAQSTAAVNLSSLRHIFPSGKSNEKPKPAPPLESFQISTAVEICDKTAAEKAPFSTPVAPVLVSPEIKVSPPESAAPEPAKAQPIEPDPPPVIEPEDDRRAHIEQAEKDYAASIDKVMAADDKLAAAHAEIKRQAAEIATLKLSRNQYQNQCAELIKRVKSLQRQLDKPTTNGKHAGTNGAGAHA